MCPRHRIRAAAAIAGLLLLALSVPGCDGGGTSPDTTHEPTGAINTPSASRGDIPQGTVALFDVRNGSAARFSSDRSLIFTQWVDSGETIVALDVNAHAYVALRRDGSLVREVRRFDVTSPTPPGEMSFQSAYVFVVHDGHRIALSDFRTGSFDLVNVISGETERIADGRLVGGVFSPDGLYMAGSSTEIAAGLPVDASQTVSGVFKASGCDTPAFTCLEWEFPHEAGFTRSFATGEPWSPDGKHLLVEKRPACSAGNAGDAPVCNGASTYEVYSWPERALITAIAITPDGDAPEWAGADALRMPRGERRFLDGRTEALPPSLTGCCASFSPDGTRAIASVIPGEDCSLIDVASGDVLAQVPKGPGDTNDTGICQYVSWTPDGRYAIASGVNTP